VVRGNTFRGNRLEAFSGSLRDALTPRGFVEWPNPGSTYDLGGGGALHYFQPDHELVENNTFQNNSVALGPAAAIYLEDVPTGGITLRGNHFESNKAGTGGVIVCNRGAGDVEVVLTSTNVFITNTVNQSAAPNVTGDCTVAAE
jgi:hypothetical protein